MPRREPTPSVAEAGLDALSGATTEITSTYLVGSALPRRFSSRLLERAGERLHTLPRSHAFRRAIADAPTGARPVVVVPRLGVGGTVYPEIRRAAASERPRFIVVALDGGAIGPPAEADAPVLEDLGLMSALPSLSVFAPADPGGAGPAIQAALAQEGAAYVRLATGVRPPVGEAGFTPGQAPVLRPGNDLTLVAVGPLVARAIEVADEIGKLGLGARVLDAGSVKPLDAKAVLRAAGETGAIITLEDHSALAGVGSQIASVTAEHRPVPVVRIGIPDLFAGPVPDLAGLDPFGLSRERVVEVALDLLRQRGKL
ncbi:MAG TPA: transketolase C-terminal domain-containing protein [Thermoplasmata archaeon]|nr:transketolase C-terminal domain-containing protein [Thermoplasmata archaeon]